MFYKKCPPNTCPRRCCGEQLRNSACPVKTHFHQQRRPGGPRSGSENTDRRRDPAREALRAGCACVCVHIGGYVWAHVHTCVPSGRPHGVRPRADGVRLSRWIVRKSRTVSLTCHQSPLSAGGWLNVTSCMTAGKRCLGLLSDDIANLWSTIKILHGFT